VLSAEEQQKLELALNELKLEVMEDPHQILRSDAEDLPKRQTPDLKTSTIHCVSITDWLSKIS
jgi:hypothetical protein